MAKIANAPSKGGAKRTGSTWNSAGTHSASWSQQSRQMRGQFKQAAGGKTASDEKRAGAAQFAAGTKGTVKPKPRFASKKRDGLELGRG